MRKDSAVSTPLLCLCLAPAYFLAARFGLSLASIQPNATPVWPPTGIALAAVVILGRRVWPGVFIGAFAANLATAGTVTTSLGIACGNTLEAVLGAYFIQRFAGGREVFSRPRHVLSYAIWTVLLSTTVSATIGVGTLSFAGFSPWPRFGQVWFVWWLGDLSSNMILAPFLLVWFSGATTGAQRSLRRVAEALALAAGGATVCYFVFSDLARYPTAFILLPILISAGLRFGQHGTTLFTVGATGLAILGTLRGEGTFGGFGPTESLALLQSYMATVALTGLFFGAVMRQRRATESALRESHDALNIALEAGNMGAWEWHMQTKRVRWSPNLETIHGRAIGSFHGTMDDAISDVLPDDKSIFDSAITDVLTNGGDYHVQYRIVRPDGELRWLEARGRLFTDDFGRPYRLAGVCMDITRRKAEEELSERQARSLASINRELEQFAFASSHDLKEPLRKIASYTGLLAERIDHLLDPSSRRFMDYISAGVRRMQNLIDGLLAYSQMAQERVDLEDADVNEIFDEVAADVETSIRESGGRVTKDALPIVRANPLHLRRLIQNLVANGMKFRGESPPHVHMSAEKRGDQWVFSVRDNGIGIAPEYREKIFQAFQRLHSPGRYPGSGIGLAICKRVVEGHGGRIWVESAPGAGSTFFFTLPSPDPATVRN